MEFFEKGLGNLKKIIEKYNSGSGPNFKQKSSETATRRAINSAGTDQSTVSFSPNFIASHSTYLSVCRYSKEKFGLKSTEGQKLLPFRGVFNDRNLPQCGTQNYS